VKGLALAKAVVGLEECSGVKTEGTQINLPRNAIPKCLGNLPITNPPVKTSMIDGSTAQASRNLRNTQSPNQECKGNTCDYWKLPYNSLYFTVS